MMFEGNLLKGEVIRRKDGCVMSGWERLANAIIEQAVEDFRNKPLKSVYKDYSDKEVEEFFKSRWFGVLSSLDGEDLFNRMKYMVKMEEKQKLAKARAAA